MGLRENGPPGSAHLVQGSGLILWFILFVPVGLFFGAGVVYNIRTPRSDRHQECLANIRRLELELFPELYPGAGQEGITFDFGPGAIWQMDRGDDLTLLQIEQKRRMTSKMLYG